MLITSCMCVMHVDFLVFMMYYINFMMYYISLWLHVSQLLA